jgi:pantoate--beta-alanine ligase
MKVLRHRLSLKKRIQSLKRQRCSIGFVPTMGALHDGHLSLVKRARKDNDIVVASLFVNPLQFGPKEDLKKYPRNFARDRKLFSTAGVDILFAPSPEEFYPPDFQSHIQVGSLSKGLCGRTRPHHFGGVATVVLRLINLVQPDRMYLGQKDFQQVRVLEQLVSDMDLSTTIVRCPIVREADGLAMSSRNVYLSPAERVESVQLQSSLIQIAKRIGEGERRVTRLKNELNARLKVVKSAKIDYAEIVDAQTLQPVVELTPLPRKREILIAAALCFSKARLIDNILIKV